MSSFHSLRKVTIKEITALNLDMKTKLKQNLNRKLIMMAYPKIRQTRKINATRF